MKPTEIHVGNVYFDGKQGLRRVVGEGAEFTAFAHQHNDDCVRYEAIGPARGGLRKVCTRESLATWAREQVPEADVPGLIQALTVKSFKLSERAQALLVRLQVAQAGQPHVTALLKGELATARHLADAGALIMPSGTQLARLSPLGEALLVREAPLADLQKEAMASTPARPRRGPR